MQIMLLACHKEGCAAVSRNHCEHLGCRDPFGPSAIRVGRHAEALKFPAVRHNLGVQNIIDNPRSAAKQLIIELHTKLQQQVAIVIYAWSTIAALP